MEKELDIFYPTDRKTWRCWLEENHDKKTSVWLLYYKKKSDKPTVSYTDAVDEALCFGWIDSKQKPIDEFSYMQFFSRRKEKSVWSKVNKEKVARLMEAGLMAKAGMDVIARAKSNGSWSILDSAEALEIPDDLEQAFSKQPAAKSFFLSLSKSDKRNILQWLVLAKRPETRQKRISEIFESAERGQKPILFRGK
jgi:uncharacterized protein YdeI (YjbR/CyaY-like superfamily)